MTTPSTSQSETTHQLLVEPGRVDLARRQLDRLLRRFSLPLLRVSLGLIFVWFGGLKVADVTPAKELVAGTVPWLNPNWLVPALGWFEIVIGAALVSGYLLGWVCAAMVGHLCGTFLTVVMQPDIMFQHGNPLMLTMEGEFVAKNLVLIMAALVIAAWARRRPTT
jgi:putative oxidoreductase